MSPPFPPSSPSNGTKRGWRERSRAHRADRRKEGRKQPGGTGCGPLSRDLALCIRRQAIARPWKIHGLARDEQMPPMSPLFSRLPVRSATISSYYRNIRFNGERQGITMHDTTPPLPRDETRHFPSGNLFFLSLHPLCAASNALPALIRPALCFHFNGVQCVYGFRCAG